MGLAILLCLGLITSKLIIDTSFTNTTLEKSLRPVE
jgi:hypothetical protein